MGGFFGLFDYNKEGPGVYLNEPPKGPAKTFFSILGRKFWKIVTVNMMYILFSLPVILIALLVGTYIFPTLIPLLQLDSLTKLLTPEGVSAAVATVTQAASQAASQAAGQAKEVVTLTPKETAAILILQFNLVLSMALIGIQLVVCGPVQAGVTYILRNYSREEHAFIWGDFKDHAKRNWKQSTLTSLIGLAVFIILSVNYTFYSNSQLTKNTFLNGALTGIVIVLFFLFTMMQMYIYPMMVTFKLNLKQLYKNALLLTLAKLPQNIGIFLLTLIITLVIPLAAVLFLSSIGFLFCLVYYVFVAFGLNLLITNFFTYRQLKKYMIDPILEEEKKAKEQAGIQTMNSVTEEPIFRDTAPKEDDNK